MLPRYSFFITILLFGAILTVPPCLAGNSIGQKQITLQDGTPIFLSLTESLSPTTARLNQIVHFKVIREVAVDEVVVIPIGAKARGIVTKTIAQNYVGQEAKLSIAMDTVEGRDGTLINLRSAIHAKGENREMLSVVGGYACCLLFGAIKGGEVKIPVGTEFKTYTNGAYKFTL